MCVCLSTVAAVVNELDGTAEDYQCKWPQTT